MEDDAGLSSEADFVQNDLIPFSMEYYLDLQKLSSVIIFHNDQSFLIFLKKVFLIKIANQNLLFD